MWSMEGVYALCVVVDVITSMLHLGTTTGQWIKMQPMVIGHIPELGTPPPLTSTLTKCIIHRQLARLVPLWSRAKATLLRAWWDKSSTQRTQTIADERRSTSFKQWTQQDVFKFRCNDEIDCFDPTPRIELHVFIGRARHVSKSR